MRALTVVLAAPFLLFAPPATAATTTGGAAVLLDYLRAAPQRMLTFRQIAFDADGDVFSRGRGRVWFGRPNKFRLEQDGEDPLIVVSDGETLMRFDPILNQAMISTAGDLARDSALAVLAGGDIEGRFSFFAPARPDDDGRRRVLARPKTDDGAAREIEFLFDAENRLLRLSFVDEFENTIRLDFGAEAATDFPESVFLPLPPPGADVFAPGAEDG